MALQHIETHSATCKHIRKLHTLILKHPQPKHTAQLKDLLHTLSLAASKKTSSTPYMTPSPNTLKQLPKTATAEPVEKPLSKRHADNPLTPNTTPSPSPMTSNNSDKQHMTTCNKRVTNTPHGTRMGTPQVHYRNSPPSLGWNMLATPPTTDRTATMFPTGHAFIQNKTFKTQLTQTTTKLSHLHSSIVQTACLENSHCINYHAPLHQRHRQGHPTPQTHAVRPPAS